MSDEQNLIKEVNEEIKQDEYNKLWKKYRTYIFSLVILVILFVSTGTFYKNYKIKKYEKQSELFFEAIKLIDNNSHKEAEKVLLDLISSKGGYSDLSKIILESIKAKNKDHSDTKSKKLDNIYLQDYFILQKFTSEKEKYLDEVKRISKPSSFWRFTAHELLGSYYLEKNDIKNAIQSFSSITNDKDAPIDMKERSLILLKKLEENK